MGQLEGTTKCSSRSFTNDDSRGFPMYVLGCHHVVGSCEHRRFVVLERFSREGEGILARFNPPFPSSETPFWTGKVMSKGVAKQGIPVSSCIVQKQYPLFVSILKVN